MTCGPGATSSSSRSRRSSSASSTSDSPSASSRSNTTYTSMPPPLWRRPNRDAPSASSAHTSPSRTAFGLRIAAGSASATAENRSVSSFPFRLRSVTRRPHRRDDPIAIPFRLVDPALALWDRARRGREHRRVSPRGCRVGLAQKKPVLGIPVEAGGDECPEALGAGAMQAGRSGLRRSSPPRAHRSRCPRSRRSPHRTARRESHPRTPRSPAGDPRHARRDGGFPASSGKPFRHRPAEQHAVPLEPEVVVEAASLMPLNDEARQPGEGLPSERLGRRLRIALAAVFARRHGLAAGLPTR